MFMKLRKVFATDVINGTPRPLVTFVLLVLDFV